MAMDYKEITKSKQVKELIDDAIRAPKGSSDLFIAPNGKAYEIKITQAKK